MTDERTLTPEEKRVIRIAQLEARLQKERSLLNKDARKARDNYLFAFGVAVEGIYKNASTEEEKNQIKQQIYGSLSDRIHDRAKVGFEILDKQLKKHAGFL